MNAEEVAALIVKGCSNYSDIQYVIVPRIVRLLRSLDTEELLSKYAEDVKQVIEDN